MSVAVKRAGDVVGTPDWQLNLMIENERERLWERYNAPDPSDDQMRKAAVHINSAVEFLSITNDRLVDAMDCLKDTTLSDKVRSFLDQLEDIQCDLFEMGKKYGRGDRT